MADWDDVRAALADLPEVVEDDGGLAWKVRKKRLAWERPLRKYEVAELGAAMREAPVLAVQVADIGVREALIADNPAVCFATSHFRDYPAVLLWLDRADPELLRELAEDAWLSQAPPTLVKAYQQR
jgi:hypothetical protein